jgi:phage-related protein
MAAAWPTSVIETPQYVWTQTNRWDAVRTPFESGYVQTCSKWSTSKRTFNMNWNYLSAAGHTALSTHWAERKGGAGSFTWTHPVEASNHTVRFVEDSLQVEMIAPLIYSVSLSVEEV